IGAVVDAQVYDLNRAYEAMLAERGEPRPKAMAMAMVPPDMLGLLEGQERSMNAARDAVA
ncbi:MAG: FAA hydrolase family protein, partial [Anaerolineae bacterium]|nr:FAA hydrolase family protein [Anaerolineae bacterium]